LFLVAEERNREQSSQADDPLQIEDAEDGDANGPTFDDTSEFARAISYNTTAVKTEPVEESVEPTPVKQIALS
jgi:U4/U6.U5 tri-snRNP-associated protein 1